MASVSPTRALPRQRVAATQHRWLAQRARWPTTTFVSSPSCIEYILILEIQRGKSRVDLRIYSSSAVPATARP